MSHRLWPPGPVCCHLPRASTRDGGLNSRQALSLALEAGLPEASCRVDAICSLCPHVAVRLRVSVSSCPLPARTPVTPDQDAPNGHLCKRCDSKRRYSVRRPGLTSACELGDSDGNGSR